MATTHTPRAFGYLRVSTQSQADSGLGLEAQQAQVASAAARLGLTLVDTFTDAGISGRATLEQRPALMQAVQMLRRGDVLLVAKRDRLGRDTLMVALIEQLVTRKGATIRSAAGEGTDGDGPADVLLRQMMDAFAQFERAIIGVRTKGALAARKSRGLVATKDAPYGFTEDAARRLTPCPHEQATIARMRALRAAGMTLQGITDTINAEGYRTRRGTPWRHQYVSRLCTSTNVDLQASAA